MKLTNPKYWLLPLLCLHVLSAWGDPIDAAKARKYAAQSGLLPALSTTARTPQLKAKHAEQAEASLDLVYTLEGDAETPLLYVFSPASQKGYVIIAGDDAVAPVVGYSPDNGFGAAAMKPEFAAFLRQMGAHVSTAAQQPAAAKALYATPTPHRAPIEPLLGPIRWGQDAPYNSQTPLDDGRKTPTGCVATALGQILFYHRYPAQATGTTYYGFSNEFKPTKTVELGSKGAYEWGKMRDAYPSGTYYTDEEANAVGLFLAEVGAGCNMRYGAQMSGAASVNALKALHRYFDYPKAQLVRRMNRSAEEWETIIYNELAARRPVYLEGGAHGLAHAFVCDGYDDKGFYHINWGWDGMANGYFNFSFLAPSVYGTGSRDKDVYVVDLQAIIGIAPHGNGIGEQSVREILSKGLTKSDDYNPAAPKLDIRGARLVGYEEINADFSLGIRQQEGGAIINVGTPSGWTMKKEVTYNKIDINLREDLVPMGNYTLFPIFSHRGKNEWQEISVGRYFKSATTVTKTADGLTVEENTEPVKLTSTVDKTFLFSGMNNTVKFKLKNEGEAAYSSFVSVYFSEQQPDVTKEVEKSAVSKRIIPVHLEPGEEREYTADAVPRQGMTACYASMTYDPTNGLSADDDIIPTALLAPHRLEVKDSWAYRGSMKTELTQPQYTVEQNAPLQATVKAVSEAEHHAGSFANLQLFVMGEDGNGVRHTFPAFEVLLNKGEEKEFEAGGPLYLAPGDYRLVLTRYENNGRTKEYKRLVEVPLQILPEGGLPTGIDHATTSGETIVTLLKAGVLSVQGGGAVRAITLYDLAGAKVAQAVATASMDISALPSGVYVVSVSTDGGTKTAKVVHRR